MLFENKRLCRKKDPKRSLYRTLNIPHSLAELWMSVDFVDLIYTEHSNTLLVKPRKPTPRMAQAVEQNGDHSASSHFKL
jgi:hypothetical protein